MGRYTSALMRERAIRDAKRLAAKSPNKAAKVEVKYEGLVNGMKAAMYITGAASNAFILDVAKNLANEVGREFASEFTIALLDYIDNVWDARRRKEVMQRLPKVKKDLSTLPTGKGAGEEWETPYEKEEVKMHPETTVWNNALGPSPFASLKDWQYVQDVLWELAKTYTSRTAELRTAIGNFESTISSISRIVAVRFAPQFVNRDLQKQEDEARKVLISVKELFGKYSKNSKEPIFNIKQGEKVKLRAIAEKEIIEKGKEIRHDYERLRSTLKRGGTVYRLISNIYNMDKTKYYQQSFGELLNLISIIAEELVIPYRDLANKTLQLRKERLENALKKYFPEIYSKLGRVLRWESRTYITTIKSESENPLDKYKVTHVWATSEKPHFSRRKDLEEAIQACFGVDITKGVSLSIILKTITRTDPLNVIGISKFLITLGRFFIKDISHVPSNYNTLFTIIEERIRWDGDRWDNLLLKKTLEAAEKTGAFSFDVTLANWINSTDISSFIEWMAAVRGGSREKFTRAVEERERVGRYGEPSTYIRYTRKATREYINMRRNIANGRKVYKDLKEKADEVYDRFKETIRKSIWYLLSLYQGFAAFVYSAYFGGVTIESAQALGLAATYALSNVLASALGTMDAVSHMSLAMYYKIFRKEGIDKELYKKWKNSGLATLSGLSQKDILDWMGLRFTKLFYRYLHTFEGKKGKNASPDFKKVLSYYIKIYSDTTSVNNISRIVSSSLSSDGESIKIDDEVFSLLLNPKSSQSGADTLHMLIKKRDAFITAAKALTEISNEFQSQQKEMIIRLAKSSGASSVIGKRVGLPDEKTRKAYIRGLSKSISNIESKLKQIDKEIKDIREKIKNVSSYYELVKYVRKNITQQQYLEELISRLGEAGIRKRVLTKALSDYKRSQQVLKRVYGYYLFYILYGKGYADLRKYREKQSKMAAKGLPYGGMWAKESFRSYIDKESATAEFVYKFPFIEMNRAIEEAIAIYGHPFAGKTYKAETAIAKSSEIGFKFKRMKEKEMAILRKKRYTKLGNDIKNFVIKYLKANDPSKRQPALIKWAINIAYDNIWKGELHLNQTGMKASPSVKIPVARAIRGIKIPPLKEVSIGFGVYISLKTRIVKEVYYGSKYLPSMESAKARIERKMNSIKARVEARTTREFYREKVKAIMYDANVRLRTRDIVSKMYFTARIMNTLNRASGGAMSGFVNYLYWAARGFNFLFKITEGPTPATAAYLQNRVIGRYIASKFNIRYDKGPPMLIRLINITLGRVFISRMFISKRALSVKAGILNRSWFGDSYSKKLDRSLEQIKRMKYK